MKKADWKLIFAAAACCVLLFLVRTVWVNSIQNSKEPETASGETESGRDRTGEENQSEAWQTEAESDGTEEASAASAGAGRQVVVKKNGSLYGVYALDEDQTVQIGETNLLQIEDGKAWMAEADCPDHYCMMQGAISVPGPVIVCLPNRVTVEIELTEAENSETEGSIRSTEMSSGDETEETSGAGEELELDAVAG